MYIITKTLWPLCITQYNYEELKNITSILVFQSLQQYAMLKPQTQFYAHQVAIYHPTHIASHLLGRSLCNR